MGHRIAIVGAGVAGLAAALRLTEAGEKVVVYEKSRGLSGRAATRTKEGCRYDFGANYFKVGCNEVAKLVFKTLPTEGPAGTTATASAPLENALPRKGASPSRMKCA